MMDRMGLGVVHHVAKLLGEATPNTQALEYARYIDEHFIQRGHPRERREWAGSSTAIRVRRSRSRDSSEPRGLGPKARRGRVSPAQQKGFS